MAGLFVTFESTGDGLGKTTQAQLLVEALTKAGFNALYTKEPGGTAVGQTLREMLLNKNLMINGKTELLMFMADRAEHVASVIRPALAMDYIVVCDRYFDSTVAYQGFGRGWSVSALKDLHLIATGNLYPHLTFVLEGDKPFREMDDSDTFESEVDEFKERVKLGMIHQVHNCPFRYRFHRIKAERPLIDIHNEIVIVTQAHHKMYNMG